MNIGEVLSRYSTVGLDTAIFIYHFEKNKTYFPLTKEIFLKLDQDLEFHAVTSILTLLEITVKPFKESRDDLLREYSAKMLYDEKLNTIMMDDSIAIKAAELRATYGIKTPDAIQIATVIIDHADAFITNDRDLRKVKELDVLILDDFLTT